MKYSLAKEHRDFFEKEGWIEFEGLISPKQVQEANAQIDHVQNRQRDLHLDIPAVKKIAVLKTIGEIGTELMRIKSVRLGYDQLLENDPHDKAFGKGVNRYLNLPEGKNLREISCLQGVNFGALVCLKNDLPDDQKKNPFPTQPGHVAFIRPEHPLSFKILAFPLPQRYLLIAYAVPNAVYIAQELDPYGYHMKELGYVYGDKLKEKHYPTVVKA